MNNSVAKNTAFITAAYVGQKIISFVYFTLVARHLGAENTGKYFFAASFTTIFVVFVDLGLTNVLVREAAKFKNKTQNYLSTILSVKIILGILSYLSAFVVINLMGYTIEVKHLVYLSAITMLFDSLHLSIYGTMRAMGNLRYEAYGIVGSQFVTLVLGTFFLYLNFPLIFLMVAFVVPSFLNVCWAGTMLYKNYHLNIIPRFDKLIFKSLGMIAIPFALAAIFARVYSYADTIILSKLAGNIAVGWYSIAYKITFAFQFIPLALVAALYPRFSECFITDKEKLRYYFTMGIKYLLIIVLPIATGIFVLAQPIILSFYKIQYLPSVMPLKILMVSLVFSFLSFPVGALLNACNKQNTQTTIVFFTLVINILLNLLLIPYWGVLGAAASALVGNIFLTVIGLFFTESIIDIFDRNLLKMIVSLLISAFIMGLGVWIINIRFHYLVAIIWGAVIYLGMLLLTGALTREQMLEARNLIKR